MTDAEEIVEAERIKAMVWDVHWESQRKINAAFKPLKPEDEVALVLLTTLLQTKQLHSFLDPWKQGPEKIKNWGISRFDVEEAGQEVVGLIPHMDRPDLIERLMTAIYGDARH